MIKIKATLPCLSCTLIHDHFSNCTLFTFLTFSLHQSFHHQCLPQIMASLYLAYSIITVSQLFCKYSVIRTEPLTTIYILSITHCPVAKLSSYTQDQMTLKGKNIYSLAIYRESLSTPSLQGKVHKPFIRTTLYLIQNYIPHYCCQSQPYETTGYQDALFLIPSSLPLLLPSKHFICLSICQLCTHF